MFEIIEYKNGVAIDRYSAHGIHEENFKNDGYKMIEKKGKSHAIFSKKIETFVNGALENTDIYTIEVKPF